MSLIRLFSRGFLIGSLIALYCGLTFLAGVFCFRSPVTRRRVVVFLGHELAKVWVWAFNIHVRTNFSELNLNPNKVYFMPSNHMSYMDVPIIFSYFPSLFITSVEIRESLGLGHFCRLSCCIFVERRKRSAVVDDIKKIKQIIAEGHNICLFPEGTSTDGSQIKPFRASLFESVVGSGVEILPLCLNYLKIDGVPVGAHNRDVVCWYGDMDFLPHFIRVLMSKKIDAELLAGENFIADQNINRKQISQQTYQTIQSLHKPTTNVVQ